MTREKYVELRKKRLKEREERFKRTRERIRKQNKAIRLRRWAEVARRKRRIEEQIFPEKRVEQERQRKATEAIRRVKIALKEVEEETKAALYLPEITRKIEEMLTDADKSFDLADYEKAINLSIEIEELMEKARQHALRRAEEKRRKRKGEGKYFYCMIPYCGEKSFGNIGMNKEEVYAIPLKEVAAIVSDSPMKDYEITEGNTRTHEAVLRQVMEEHTVIPVEFGTVIRNEAILRSLMTKSYDLARECLKLVDNMVELGVKAVLNKDIVFVDNERRKECTSDILVSLNTKAKQAVMGDLFSDRLFLNASFLVNKIDIEAFSKEVESLQEKYPILKFLYSGPWAPYNFVYIKIGARGMEVTRK